MKRSILIVAVVAMVSLSGCAAVSDLGASGDENVELPDGPADVGGAHVQTSDNATDATNVNYTMRVAVDESTAESELSSVGATFPRDRFLVDSAKHEAVSVGIDENGDGTVDRTFEASAVSGVNNNDYSFDVTLDTDYTLQQGDVVVVQYPAITNPAETGEYPVAVRLNDDQQRSTGNVTIG